MLLVFVLFFGVKINGARGWFDIPGVPFLLQPTEFLKLTLIMYFAYLFKVRRNDMFDFQNGLLPFLSILGVVILLV